jgi:hypothetical protein
MSKTAKHRRPRWGAWIPHLFVAVRQWIEREVQRQVAAAMVRAWRQFDRMQELRMRRVEWCVFELAEEMEDINDTGVHPVKAFRAKWDPTANSGDGGYSLDCDDLDCIDVADWGKIGYYGDKGTWGKAYKMKTKNGVVWVVFDLGCDPVEDCQEDDTDCE